MAQTIHVIEPTLEGEAGHGRSFMAAVMAAGPDHRFEVWAGRRAGALFEDLPQACLHPHFERRVRRLQALLLYRRLLRGSDRIFLPTAGVTDLTLVDLASKGAVPSRKATFFFHWIRPTAARRRRLARVAKRQPNLRVLGATREIVATLEEAGFSEAHLVPYPVTTSARPPEDPGFRHLLFAGAARQDKGFGRVVDLVALLQERGEKIPVVVQTSARHYRKRDAAVAADMERLLGLTYSGLRAEPETLTSDAYLRLFHGAICLQPYERAEFEGRVSAVTVDALASGCPIITTAGTWMAHTVERLGAGITLEDLSAAELHSAVRTVVAQYDRYSANAREAAKNIQAEHSGAHLLRAVLS